MGYPRRTQIILNCLSRHEYITTEELACEAHVSKRTIYSDITAINDVLTRHGAEIASKPRRGMKLVVSDDAAFRSFVDELNSDNACEDDADSRAMQVALRLLSASEPIRMDDLCKEFYVSRSTMQGDIRRVRRQLAKSNLTLESRPYGGMFVDGEEQDVRRALARIEKQTTVKRIAQQDASLMLVGHLLQSALRTHDYRLSELAFHSLTIHLHVMMGRLRDGHTLGKSYLSSCRSYIDPKDERVVKDVVFGLEREHHIRLGEKEVDYILAHLVSKKTVSQDDNTVIDAELYEMVLAMLDEINEKYHIDLRSDFELIAMLCMHMIPLRLRLMFNLTWDNPEYTDIRENYPLAYEIATVVGQHLKGMGDRPLPSGEIAYLALYLNIALERYAKKTQQRVNVLVVCGTGRGSAQMLEYQLKERFGTRINRIYVHESHRLDDVDFKTIDYVLSTVQIDEVVPVPIIQIKRLFTDASGDVFHQYLAQDRQRRMLGLLSPALFFPHLKGSSMEAVLKDLCNKVTLVKGEFCDLYDMVLERERMGSTYFGNGVAIPHPYRLVGPESFVAIALLDHPVAWGDGEARLVLLASMKEGGDEELRLFFKMASRLIVSPKLVQSLVDLPTWPNLCNVIQELS